MEHSIVFCGLKHCGKSTHGKRLAEALGYPFIDTDDLMLREATGCACTTCRELFRQVGETGFRQREAETLRQLAETPHHGRVVALGGGIAGNPFVNPAVLHRLGFLVYLDLAPETAYERILAGGLPPFLATAADPRAAFLERHRQHDGFYRRHADCIIPLTDGESPEEAAVRVRHILTTELKQATV